MFMNSIDPLEFEHYLKIKRLFKEYRKIYDKRLYDNWVTSDKLLMDEPALMKRVEKELDLKRDAVEKNQIFFDYVVEFNEMNKFRGEVPDVSIPLALDLLDRLTSMLKQIVREWTEFGKNERVQHEIFIKELELLFPGANRSEIKILIPGCGLGRLNYDVHRQGYSVEGNEISMFCLLIANVLLNTPEKFVICPYATQSSNLMHINQSTKCFIFPDIDHLKDMAEDKVTRSATEFGTYSITAGDFSIVYADGYDESYDCVITNFFIDTGKNIVEYIRIIHKILKRDGFWLNFGPLLYHYEDNSDRNHHSICLTGENVRMVMNKYFEIKKWEYPVESLYANCEDMMCNYKYKCINSICKKRVMGDQNR